MRGIIALALTAACLFALPARAGTVFATPSTYAAALKAAKAGDTVAFVGVFQRPQIRGLKPAGTVTLDFTRATVTGQIHVADAADLAFVGGAFEALRLDRTGRISFTGATVSGPAPSGQAAFNIIDVTDCRIEGVTFVGTWKGLALTRATRCAVAGNTFLGMRSDAINLSGWDSVRIEGNDIRAWGTYAATDHPDAIQFWTATGQAPSRALLVRGNRIDAPSGVQGIFGHSAPGSNVGQVGTVIEGNDVTAGAVRGVSLGGYGITGAVVRNNAVRTAPGSPWQSTIVTDAAVHRACNTVAAYGGKPAITDKPC